MSITVMIPCELRLLDSDSDTHHGVLRLLGVTHDLMAVLFDDTLDLDALVASSGPFAGPLEIPFLGGQWVLVPDPDRVARRARRQLEHNSRRPRDLELSPRDSLRFRVPGWEEDDSECTSEDRLAEVARRGRDLIRRLRTEPRISERTVLTELVLIVDLAEERLE